MFSLDPKELIFSSDQFNLHNDSSILKVEENLSLKDQDILLKEKIMLDDQNLPGPNARIQGILVSRIKLENLKVVIPEIKRIKWLSQDSAGDNVDLEIIEKNSSSLNLLRTFFLMTFFLILSIFLGLYLFRTKLLNPLRVISLKLQSQKDEKFPNEIIHLEKAIESYIHNLKLQEFEKNEKEKLLAANLLASQVAHDIRSPLTALNMVIGTVDKLPEDKRIIIRGAIQRINDIANELLSKGKGETHRMTNSEGIDTQETHLKEFSTTVMLSSLVDTLVSEKRIQFRDKIGVQIDVELSKSYGLFSSIPHNEFKRVLSNLINNSVEALPNETGRVLVVLDELDGMIRLEIIDNGKGIPVEILAKLGTAGVTHGKDGTQSGSGLGIYHAKSVIEAAGGKIQFTSHNHEKSKSFSTFPPSTTITILIPKSDAPKWFVGQLEIPLGAKVVVLDDDQSIHSIWQGRMASMKALNQNVDLISFTSAEVFKKWISSLEQPLDKIICLVDYELLGQKVTGLDVVEELGIQKFSILVSSRYEENNVIERCRRLGIRMIPKAMAGLVPMQIIPEREQFDAILIDDDDLVHMTWQMKSRSAGIKFKGFKDPSEIDFSTLAKQTKIYIDSNLANNQKGEELAQQLHHKGFTELYLATGYEAQRFSHLSFLKGVIDKMPPWK